METDDPNKIVELSERRDIAKERGSEKSGKKPGSADREARRELFKEVILEAKSEAALQALTEQEKYFVDCVVDGDSLGFAFATAWPELAVDGDGCRLPTTRLYTLGARKAKLPSVRAYLSTRLDEEEGESSHTSSRLNNFVLKRLEHEAEYAKTDGARLKALEMIAKHKAVQVSEDIAGAKAKADRTSAEVIEEIQKRITKLTTG